MYLSNQSSVETWVFYVLSVATFCAVMEELYSWEKDCMKYLLFHINRKSYHSPVSYPENYFKWSCKEHNCLYSCVLVSKYCS